MIHLNLSCSLHSFPIGNLLKPEFSTLLHGHYWEFMRSLYIDVDWLTDYALRPPLYHEKGRTGPASSLSQGCDNLMLISIASWLSTIKKKELRNHKMWFSPVIATSQFSLKMDDYFQTTCLCVSVRTGMMLAFKAMKAF